jgi:hypothetical protein
MVSYMGLKKNQSVITHIEVTFAEIDALFDVTSVQRAVLDSKGTRLIYNTKISKGSISEGAFALFTEDGSLYDDLATEMPGAYRFMRVTEAPYFVWQTFDRKSSVPVGNGRYVYVWATNQRDGSGLRLLHELQFQGGSFQFLRLDPNDRSAQGGSQSRLLLQLVSFQDAKPDRLYYFFYLTPLQLPWGQLDAMKEDVPARAMRLWDAFYTDVYSSEDPAKAVSLDQVMRGGRPSLPPHLMCRMHLLNPLKEALRRSAIYKNALQQWEDKQKEMGSDDEYLLAKRLQAFTAPEHSEFDADIAPRLGPYLDKKEADSRRLYLLTLLTAQDLLRWIGAKHQREKYKGKYDTWFSDGRNRIPSLQDYGADLWHNAFCQASRDFLASDPPVLSEVHKIVNFAHERLEATPNGRNWMEAIVERGFKKDLEPLESGASEYLFQAGRKGEDAVLKGVSVLLKTWAPVWVRHFRQDALSSLRHWMSDVNGIALEEATPSQYMSGVRRLGWARKQGIDKLDIEPAVVKALHASEQTLKLFHAAIETVNLYYAVVNLQEHRDDPWAYLETAAAAADFFYGMEELKVLPEMVKDVKLLGKIREVPVFAVAAGLFDTILGAKSVLTSDNLGQRVGNGLRTLGGGCTVVGAVSSEEGVGLLIWAGGLALASAGTFVQEYFSPVHAFLRHSRWGEVGMLDRVEDAIKNQDSFWYQGDLRQLSGDITAQHRCLDEFIYNFEPQFVFEAGQSVIVGAALGVRIKMARGAVGPKAKWHIDVDVERQYGDTPPGAPERYTYQASEDFSDKDISGGGEFIAKSWARSDNTDPMSDKAYGNIFVSVEARLDVFGDGKHVIKRENKGSFDLESSVKAEEVTAQE